MSDIVVIDFGSQTAHLIARRIRDMGVGISLIEPAEALEKISSEKPKGLIFSGGPASVYIKGSPTVDPKIFFLGIPILGICYGMQLTGFLLQGHVKPGKIKEYGPAMLRIDEPSLLLEGLSGKPFQVWMSHGDQVIKPPSGFKTIASTETIPIAAMHDQQRNIYCIQFHPEVEHTRFGTLILKNFLTICGFKTKKQKINLNSIVTMLKKEIGTGRALIAVSGGVDSTVAAALATKAIGKRLIPVYIESGLMRPGTRESLVHLFTSKFHIKPIVIDATNRFLFALEGKKDPEQKRKTIGTLYIKLFEEESKKHKNVTTLIQGTIYSDVIESRGTKHASKIKSHHNVGGLPQKMNLKIVEPLRQFYKDEVRMTGKKLGLPSEFIHKQVFPGPGYAIRIIGEVTRARLEQEKLADTIVLEEITKAELLNKVFMSFAIMTGTKSTAVKGDGRFYGEVVAVRVIESSDVMTTNWSRLPYGLLQKISSRIVNEVPGVSRVVYDITTKPPATMEWE